MPLAQSSPSDEFAARRASTGPRLANGLLTEDLVQFCQSGVSVVLATSDGDRRPVVGRGLACRIDEAGNIRLVLRKTSNSALMAAVAAGAGLAVTFTKPSTHRSIQLKSSSARTAEPDVSDAAPTAQQTAALRAELVEDGFWEAFAARYCGFDPHELAVIEFFPEHAFVQTPGPGAGSSLTP